MFIQIILHVASQHKESRGTYGEREPTRGLGRSPQRGPGESQFAEAVVQCRRAFSLLSCHAAMTMSASSHIDGICDRMHTARYVGI